MTDVEDRVRRAVGAWADSIEVDAPTASPRDRWVASAAGGRGEGDLVASYVPDPGTGGRHRARALVAAAALLVVIGATVGLVVLRAGDSTQAPVRATDEVSTTTSPTTTEPAVPTTSPQTAVVESLDAGATFTGTEWADLVAPIEVARGPVSGTVVSELELQVEVFADGSWTAGDEALVTMALPDGTTVSRFAPGKRVEINRNRAAVVADGRGRAFTTDDLVNRVLYPSAWIEAKKMSGSV